jgi:hypothetical protein
MAPARTGRERSRRRAVIPTDHTNKGMRSNVILGVRILIMVVIKLIAPRIDLAPARCREKIERSILAPEWAMFLERGG